MLNKISPHLYWTPPDHSNDRPIMGAVAGERGTLVVEGGNSEAHARAFLEGMRALGLAEPMAVVETHSHWDHVFGAGTFGVPIFASEATRKLVTEMAGLDWSDEALDRRVAEGTEIAFCRANIQVEFPDPARKVAITPPNVAFEGPVTVDLGGVTARLVPVGGDHAGDSTVVYVPEDRVMFLGDCLYPDLHHGPDNYSVAKLFPLIDTVLGFDVEWYLGAHQDEPVPYAEMAAYLAMHKRAGQAVERLGEDREAALAALQAEIERWGREEVEAVVDAFEAGKKLQVMSDE